MSRRERRRHEKLRRKIGGPKLETIPILEPAHAHRQAGRFDDAVALYSRALEIDPDFAPTHNNLGVALKGSGRVEDAVASYHKALSIKPDYTEAHYNLGNALHDLGRLDDAVASYHQALAIQPDYAAALFNLHGCLYTGTDLEPAAQCLEEAVKIAPDNKKYRFFLGVIRDYQGRTEAAARHFDCLTTDAAGLDPKLDSWRYVKSVADRLPPLFGPTAEGLRLGLEAARVDGLVLEFGVRYGTTIRQISVWVDQDVYGFDSFQGLPEAWGPNPKGLYSTHGELPEVPDTVHLHAGLFDETLPPFLERHAGPVRFMNVDCDLYSSTKTVLDLCADRIVPGTVIIFDEYLLNATWREDEFKAFQQAVKRYGWRYDYLAVSLFSNQAVIRIQ